MTYFEHSFNSNTPHKSIQYIYDSIESLISVDTVSSINTIFNDDILRFNVHKGDITHGIKWIWASSLLTLDYFDDFFKSIDLEKTLLKISPCKFTIRGASFITLNKSCVDDSDFHYDAVSHHDTPETNILTVIFPLFEIDKDVGHLNYMENGVKKVYTYTKHKIIVWDSCKFLHKTQPYNVDKNVKRVLVSINLSTDYDWSKYTINKSLQSQGNKLWID